MEIAHEWQNGPELLFAKLDNCDNERHELKLLEPILRSPEKTGTAYDDEGNVIKDNRGIFLNEVYTSVYAECSPVSKTLDSFIKKQKSLSIHQTVFFKVCTAFLVLTYFSARIETGITTRHTVTKQS